MAEDYSPGSREIVAAIIDLWKTDSETESLGYAKLLARLKAEKQDAHWVLSEKRMRAALKEFNLQPNQPPYTYAKQIKSSNNGSTKCPAGVRIEMTKNRGKGLFTTKAFKAGEEIWSESPLVLAAPADRIGIVRAGDCCSYCADIIQVSPNGTPVSKTAVACTICQSNWCSTLCKNSEIVHIESCHDGKKSKNLKLNQSQWKLYEQFCLKNSWNAGYLYGCLLLHKLKHGSNSHFASIFDGLAVVRQDLRQRAVSDPNSLDFESVEQMWNKGYKYLSEAVNNTHKLSYEEYLNGIGSVNINNIRGCIFEVHSNLNHNCTPNVKIQFKDGSKSQGISVTAKVDIEPNQELLTSYVDPDLDVFRRAEELRINWGFVCVCTKCKNDRASAKAKPKSGEKEKQVHFE